MTRIYRIFSGFEWDKGNRDKNLLKHSISCKEAEECFFNFHVTLKDEIHSTSTELRHVLLGETDSGRSLFVAFALRNGLVRVISARPMHRKERSFYEKIKEKSIE